MLAAALPPGSAACWAAFSFAFCLWRVAHLFFRALEVLHGSRISAHDRVQQAGLRNILGEAAFNMCRCER